MGTQDPLVRIEAATLAGGDNNQDRYAYGDGWAFVLDGASSFSERPPVHDGGWYAERLKNSLEERLPRNPGTPICEIVAQAIREASEGHDVNRQGPCPTSTISLVRWTAGELEFYVLGDSFAAVIFPPERIGAIVRDSRIEAAGRSARNAYRKRLRAGYGFDSQHRRLLAELQTAQSGLRNQTNGYWIAGDDPHAAFRGVSKRISATESSILLFTDGLTSVQSAETACHDLVRATDVQSYLDELRGLESADAAAARFPSVLSRKFLVSLGRLWSCRVPRLNPCT